MGAPDPETFRALSQAPWGPIFVRLTAYIEVRARQYRWSSGTSDVLPDGMTPEHIAADLIVKTLGGDRVWTPGLGELEPWLREQVRSELSNLVTSAEHKLTRPLIESDLLADGTQSSDVMMDSDGRPETPETRLLAVEEAEERRRVLCAAAEGDEELEELVLVGLDLDDPAPRFLSEALGVPVRKVEIRARRLARRLRKARES